MQTTLTSHLRNPRSRWLALLTLFCFVLPVQAQWTNNQAAVNVIGQPNFTSSGSGTSDTTLQRPIGVAVDPTTTPARSAESPPIWPTPSRCRVPTS